MATPLLVLQLPTPDTRRAYVLASTDDPQIIQLFRLRMQELGEEAIELAADPFVRELAYLELQQLQARLDYATRTAEEHELEDG